MSDINLLPPVIKDDLVQAKKNREAIFTFIRSLLLLIVLGAACVFVYLYLTNKTGNLSDLLKEKNDTIDSFGSLEDNSRDISDKLSTIKRIDSSLNNWSGVIEEIQKIMPSGVYLSEIEMASQKGLRGKLTGYANSKTEVATLRETMENSEKFEYVDIEKSSTSQIAGTKKDIENFTFSFSLEKGALDE